ncbi:hypothetical protein [Ruegeria arenilitoris]|uniref:hypothetical protein n=1 Tax=Ruegeria arenilitoris TaxID=1173585 RepID=UPI001479FB52|nr:hypothetical protein [Ruegeria arenilitoris]
MQQIMMQVIRFILSQYHADRLAPSPEFHAFASLIDIPEGLWPCLRRTPDGGVP